MKIDPLLKLALAVQSNPGAYALLLGSGISRSAAILSGWEILVDLIRKVAAIHGEPAEPDPERWFRSHYGEGPDYSRVLAQLASRPAERMALLRPYFEPTEADRENGAKLPTPAHRAIAEMVAAGYLRVIITTNFDRLLEVALEAAGVPYEAAYTPDALQGLLPYALSRCVVIKVNGDYKDTRIRNTRRELAKYHAKLNAYLDRVLDDFGLIICGWSAIWDIALRDALVRSGNRRFGYFWSLRGDISDAAGDLIRNKRAEAIRGMDANAFFQQLQEKVQSLADLATAEPYSEAVAVATTKRYIADDRYRIRLFDLVQQETAAVHELSVSDRLQPRGPMQDGDKQFQQSVVQLQIASSTTAGILGTIAFHGTGSQAELLSSALSTLITIPHDRGGMTAWLNLRYLPGLLALYAAGVAAIAAEHYEALAALLLRTRGWNPREDATQAAGEFLHPWTVFEHGIQKLLPQPAGSPDHLKVPASEYLYHFIRPRVAGCISTNEQYDRCFCRFEYVQSLICWAAKKRWAPPGRYTYRWFAHDETSEWLTFYNEITGNPAKGLLGAGFFDGSVQRFEELAQSHSTWEAQVYQQLRW